MERAKYPHEEIDKMIDDEISRIDAANSVADDRAVQHNRRARRSTLDKIFDLLRARVRQRKRRK